MKWNRAPKVERPEYPKLIPVAGSVEEAGRLLGSIQAHDPDAEIVDGGDRGSYLRVHNPAAEEAAIAEKRDFQLR
ncbi:hypothetical protein SPAN111604_14035 [Sphingomonas antarctica]|uniref:hypothetical protein n=1 Tax=Sphingomonas antarctica TaxID=2040274 RepID=UPI0039EBA500